MKISDIFLLEITFATFGEVVRWNARKTRNSKLLCILGARGGYDLNTFEGILSSDL